MSERKEKSNNDRWPILAVNYSVQKEAVTYRTWSWGGGGGGGDWVQKKEEVEVMRISIFFSHLSPFLW